MFLPSETIQKVKQIPIIGYLANIGIEPVETGNQYKYYSPFTNEKTPSFYVSLKKNLFNDYSSGKGGSIIDLVMLLEKCSFTEAAKKLENEEPVSFSFSRNERTSKEPMKVTAIKELENPNLIAYAGSRAISTTTAKRYLKEIHYTNKGRSYYAIGFKNDADGYELRSGNGFKSKTANGITTIDKGTKAIALFEGFFDFLSALEYYKLESPNVTTIILNTTVNLRIALPLLQGKKVNCFLDNDKAGFDTIQKLINDSTLIVNQSLIIYPKAKDFNDYLTNKITSLNEN
jgi:DNA primase